MALAMVLWSNAQDVWQGSDPRQDTDARARYRLGQYCNGSRLGKKAKSVAQVHSAGKGKDRSASGLPVLS
jgi:hypothetical protein